MKKTLLSLFLTLLLCFASACAPPASPHEPARLWYGRPGDATVPDLKDGWEGDYRLLAWLLTEQGRADPALPLLEKVLHVLQPAEAVRAMISAYILQSLAWHALDQPGQSLAALDKAITLAEPGEFVRIFIDRGEIIQSLLGDLMAETRLQKQPRKQKYLGRVVAAFPGKAPAEALPSPAEMQAAAQPGPAGLALSAREETRHVRGAHGSGLAPACGRQ